MIDDTTLELMDAESRPKSDFRPVEVPQSILKTLSAAKDTTQPPPIIEIEDKPFEPGFTEDRNFGNDAIDPDDPQIGSIGAGGDKKNVVENSDGKVKYSLSELIDPETGADLLAWSMPLLAMLMQSLIPAMHLGTRQEIERDMGLNEDERKALQKPLEKLFADTQIGTKSPLLALLMVYLLIMGMKVFMMYQARKDDTLEYEEGPLPENQKPEGVRKAAARKRRPAARRTAPASAGTPLRRGRPPGAYGSYSKTTPKKDTTPMNQKTHVVTPGGEKVILPPTGASF